ncbi:MAG: ThiF family adenylyltransferase [Lysinibacillus sp.]
MEKLKILLEVKVNKNILSEKTIEKFDRQLNYFSEFLETKEEAYIAQKNVSDTRFLIFGVGAIGANIAMQLVMAGAEYITLYDYDKVSQSDITRHIYFSETYVGMKKVDALSLELQKINPNVTIKKIDGFMHPSSEITDYIQESNFVINTLDEPYIGYTSAKISRICTPLRIPHFIAGGFDAHLASTGELIIPGVTPCVECYATYFKEALKDWKPKVHPVKERFNEIGGLASMSLFSSSFAVTEIIKYLTDIVPILESYKTRGELLFKDLNLTYITLDKNPDCQICGKLSDDL